MKTNIITISILSSFLSLQSCNNKEAETQSEDNVEEGICNCLELSLDEPFNHFYLTDRTKPFNGECEVSNSQNIVILKKTFKNGKLDGPYLEFFDNGQLKHEWNFTENRQNGDQKIYNESGELIHHSKHIKGDLDTIYVNKSN
jgi:hypothetical protein